MAERRITSPISILDNRAEDDETGCAWCSRPLSDHHVDLLTRCHAESIAYARLCDLVVYMRETIPDIETTCGKIEEIKVVIASTVAKPAIPAPPSYLRYRR